MSKKPISIKIKRFDTDLPMPKKHSSKAACFDLYARLETVIEPGDIGYIPLNVAIQVPDDYWVMVAARSSLHKHGLWLANGIGIGDADFSGDDDEYKLAVYNFIDTPVTIEKGDRIAQMMVLPVLELDVEEVASFNKPSRGGFGSTGK